MFQGQYRNSKHIWFGMTWLVAGCTFQRHAQRPLLLLQVPFKTIYVELKAFGTDPGNGGTFCYPV
jgi:hypothetical protein